MVVQDGRVSILYPNHFLPWLLLRTTSSALSHRALCCPWPFSTMPSRLMTPLGRDPVKKKYFRFRINSTVTDEGTYHST